MITTSTPASQTSSSPSQRILVQNASVLEWLADYFSRRSRGGRKPAHLDYGVLSDTGLNHKGARSFRDLYHFDHTRISQYTIPDLYNLMTAQQPAYHTYFFDTFVYQCEHRKGCTVGLSEDLFDFREYTFRNRRNGDLVYYAIHYMPPSPRRKR